MPEVIHPAYYDLSDAHRLFLTHRGFLSMTLRGCECLGESAAAQAWKLTRRDGYIFYYGAQLVLINRDDQTSTGIVENFYLPPWRKVNAIPPQLPLNSPLTKKIKADIYAKIGPSVRLYPGFVNSPNSVKPQGSLSGKLELVVTQLVRAVSFDDKAMSYRTEVDPNALTMVLPQAA